MSTFNAEQIKTSEKMSDLVMEYVSLFIARDFLETYEKANETGHEQFVPPEFDEKIYKKIAKTVRKTTGQNAKVVRKGFSILISAIGVLCAVFTAFVMLHESMRNEVIAAVLSFINLN